MFNEVAATKYLIVTTFNFINISQYTYSVDATALNVSIPSKYILLHQPVIAAEYLYRYQLYTYMYKN